MSYFILPSFFIGLGRELDDKEDELRDIVQRLNMAQDEIVQLRHEIENVSMFTNRGVREWDFLLLPALNLYLTKLVL